MYLPIETECYSVDHRKSCQRAESWKLSQPSAGRGLPGAGSLHRINRYRDDRIYDDCAADHVILPSFRFLELSLCDSFYTVSKRIFTLGIYLLSHR